MKRFLSKTMPKLAQPFDHDGWTYYSNGHALVRVRGECGRVAPISMRRIAAAMDEPHVGPWSEWPEYPDPRCACLGTAGRVRCETCCGSGQHECGTCRAGHHCGDCDGSGSVACRHEVSPQMLGDVRVNWWQGSLFSGLPGLEFYARENMVTIRFDGGEGLLMGLRP